MSILEQRFNKTVYYGVGIVAIVLCLAGCLFYVLFTVPASIAPQMSDEAARYADYYADLYAAGKIDRNSQAMYLLSGRAGLPRSIYYYDENNLLLSQTGMYTEPLTMTQDILPQLLEQARCTHAPVANYTLSTLTWVLFSKRFLIYCTPSIVNDKYAGATVVTYDMHWIRNTVFIGIIQYVCFTFLLCISLYLFARRYIRQLLKNIETIAAYIRTGASGEQTVAPLSIKTGDELELIADGFNRSSEQSILKNRQLQEFSANVAHQLRTPLAAIQASTEVIQLLNQEPNIADMAASILRNTEWAQDTTESLLILSRVDNYLQGAELLLEEFDLDGIIRNEIDLIVQRGEPATRFEYTCCGDCNIYAVPALLSQVVRNLLSNAVKYAPAASAIDIALISEKTTLKLTVCDHGPGINDADFPYIFDRFYRGQTSKHLKGSGLGLALTKAIVSLFHGDITVENNPAEGVTFSVLLPK